MAGRAAPAATPLKPQVVATGRGGGPKSRFPRRRAVPEWRDGCGEGRGQEGHMNEPVGKILEHKGARVETVAPQALVIEAGQKMNEKRIGALPVIEKES